MLYLNRCTASVPLILALAIVGCAGTAGNRVTRDATTSAEALTPLEDSITVPTAQIRPDYRARPESPLTPTNNAAAAQPPAFGNDYLIGSGDVLMLRSFDDASLSGPVAVRYDGYISLPLVPDIDVAGLTRAEATERVRVAYRQIFTSPQVSLSINQVNSKSYFVMGDVTAPNEYPYTRPITLLDAINIAGGSRIDTRGGDSFIGGQGQLTQVFIIRHSNGERHVLEYNLYDLTISGAHASDTPVYPHDIIYVPEGRNLVYALGEVGRPDVFELTEGMTLLQLLVLAGGPNEVRGKLRQVVLIREVDDENSQVELYNVRKMLKTGYNPRLQAGDIMYIPRKLFTRLSDFSTQFAASASPLLSLYTQAFDAYYADKRGRLLYGSGGQATAAPDVFPLTLQSVEGMLPN